MTRILGKDRLQLFELVGGSLAGLERTGLVFRAIAGLDYYDMEMLELNLSVRWHRSFG